MPSLRLPSGTLRKRTGNIWGTSVRDYGLIPASATSAATCSAAARCAAFKDVGVPVGDLDISVAGITTDVPALAYKCARPPWMAHLVSPDSAGSLHWLPLAVVAMHRRGAAPDRDGPADP